MFSKYTFLISLLITLLFLSCGDQSVTDPDPPENGDDPEFSFDHQRGAGSSATAFLTDDDFSELIVEVQYMNGYRPENSALENLERFLEERLNKSAITIMEPQEISSGGESSYSASDVRDIEEENRTAWSEEGRLAAYILILDAEFDQENVLGIAHFNTSMALFGETVDRVSGGIGQPSRSVVETTILLHEAGHLFGLVNNGIEMQEPHHDEENGAHCDVDSCLMYFAVNTTDFIANVFGGSVPELDDFCIADLQAAGGR
ncbi:MAG: hypothetical protein JJU37_01095 [Balneolaceae bacterium]|nr:hypothetical protein [Balneolaceae bacterium]